MLRTTLILAVESYRIDFEIFKKYTYLSIAKLIFVSAILQQSVTSLSEYQLI